MSEPAALYVTMKGVSEDPALQPGGRGARKLLITTEPYENERLATEPVWKAHPTQCPVQQMPDTEIAVFTHLSPQDRHYHNVGTEIYMVMSGSVIIEAKGVNYPLEAGDMLVVNPRVVHEVKAAGLQFLCRAVTLQCKGNKDKFVVAPGVTEPQDQPDK